MQTSIYVPDDLHAELKARGAPISAIAREALEDWLINDEHGTHAAIPISVALRVLQEAVQAMPPTTAGRIC